PSSAPGARARPAVNPAASRPTATPCQRNFGCIGNLPTESLFYAEIIARFSGRRKHHGADAALLDPHRGVCDIAGMQWTFIIIAVVIVYLAISIRVLRQYERGVVFLLGRFEGVRGAGLTLIFVPFQQMVRVSLRTVTMQIPSQKIITKDNVSIDIAAVVLLSHFRSGESGDRY